MCKDRTSCTVKKGPNLATVAGQDAGKGSISNIKLLGEWKGQLSETRGYKVQGQRGQGPVKLCLLDSAPV